VKIEYAATPEDVGALYSYLWKNSAYFRWKIGLGTLVVAAWILLSVYISQGELVLRDAFIAVNAAIAIPLLTPVLAMLRTKRGSRILSIDFAGIHTRLGRKERTVSWRKVSQIFVTSDHVFILGSNLDSFTIPNRAFPTDAAKDEFIRLCRDYSKQLPAHSQKRVLVSWLLAFSAVLPAIFAPHLYEIGWHLARGDSLLYKDKRVPVPRGWTAHANKWNLTITKMSPTLFTYFRFEKPNPGISISKGSPLNDRTIEQAEESFEKSFWTYPPPQAYSAEIAGPVKIRSTSDSVYCMTATQSGNDSNFYVKCLFQHATWEAEFLGTRTDVDKFYEILRGVR